MSSNLIILLEFGTVVGAVVGFGVWEIWKLARERRARGRAGDHAPDADTPEQPSGDSREL